MLKARLRLNKTELHILMLALAVLPAFASADWQQSLVFRDPTVDVWPKASRSRWQMVPWSPQTWSSPRLSPPP